MPKRSKVERGGVPEANPQLIPVRDVEQPGDHVATQLAQRGGLKDRGVGHDQDKHDVQRRKKAARTPLPEPNKRHGVGAFAFRDDEQRDEVAGDHEEHLDTEEPTRQP